MLLLPPVLAGVSAGVEISDCVIVAREPCGCGLNNQYTPTSEKQTLKENNDKI